MARGTVGLEPAEAPSEPAEAPSQELAVPLTYCLFGGFQVNPYYCLFGGFQDNPAVHKKRRPPAFSVLGGRCALFP